MDERPSAVAVIHTAHKLTHWDRTFPSVHNVTPVLTVADEASDEASNDPPFLLPLENLLSPYAENTPITHSPATHYVNANKYKYDPSELITWSRRVGGPQDGAHWVSCIHEALSGACCKQRPRRPPFLGCKSPPASGTLAPWYSGRQECGHLVGLCTLLPRCAPLTRVHTEKTDLG